MQFGNYYDHETKKVATRSGQSSIITFDIHNIAGENT